MNMTNERTCGRDLFIQGLLSDLSPLELPLLPDYLAAINAPEVKSVDGLEFGIEGIAEALGPAVVFVGSALFTDLGKWAIEGSEELIKKYIKAGYQKALSNWMRLPVKGALKEVLTEEGKAELMAMVRASFRGKKVSKEKIDRVMAALQRRLFEP
jgi:hypothetical protein